MKPSKTALFKAAKSWDVTSLTALLASAPELIDATDPLVKMLLKRGARADNCLFAVVWNDNAAVLREILKTGPPLNELGEGEPAVVAAIRWRKLKTLGMLLDAGADLSFRDAKGRDALAFARHKKLPPPVLARLEALQSAK